ncbi:uncharacterized protein LOC143253871 [Tachypleus tridentatus]|uniref:uncharacterized protein LOC143253871 n=1 Tax=Tachypleus tridentatus TaxID=6853 RepID=UPI003FCF4D83
MAGLSPRTVAVCVIPALIAILSIIWLRKNRKKSPELDRSLVKKHLEQERESDLSLTAPVGLLATTRVPSGGEEDVTRMLAKRNPSKEIEGLHKMFKEDEFHLEVVHSDMLCESEYQKQKIEPEIMRKNFTKDEAYPKLNIIMPTKEGKLINEIIHVDEQCSDKQNTENTSQQPICVSRALDQDSSSVSKSSGEKQQIPEGNVDLAGIGTIQYNEKQTKNNEISLFTSEESINEERFDDSVSNESEQVKRNNESTKMRESNESERSFEKDTEKNVTDDCLNFETQEGMHFTSDISINKSELNVLRTSVVLGNHSNVNDSTHNSVSWTKDCVRLPELCKKSLDSDLLNAESTKNLLFSAHSSKQNGIQAQSDDVIHICETHSIRTDVDLEGDTQKILSLSENNISCTDAADCTVRELDTRTVSYQNPQMCSELRTHSAVPIYDASNLLDVRSVDSPPHGSLSDGLSEGSSDSGKGGSDIQFGADSSQASQADSMITVYEFEIPQDLCGRLIGRQGKHVNYIKSCSNANVFIKRHLFNPRMKLCVIEGTEADIKTALHLIRKKFPLTHYPMVTLVQVNVPLTCGIPVPETLQLLLPEGVSCDTILSSMVTAGHFFLQQPTHPTYPSLSQLDQCMTTCYIQVDTPRLPQPVEASVVCAASMMGGWFRAQIMYVHENMEDCDIKFVDYGGYSRVPVSSLRQIRSDFMTLPFQATECYLANVKPVNDEATWSLEACATFEELAQGQILQAMVVTYAEDGVPYVHLYRVQGLSSLFINRELVNRGVAQWIEHQG